VDELSHTILYRAGHSARIDAYNIKLWARIAHKSTTPVFIEIYYYEPLKLADFAIPEDRVRYVRLRSGEEFPVAERIARTQTSAVIVCDGSIAFSASDIWQLLAVTMHRGIASLAIDKSLVGENMHLEHYLNPQGRFDGRAFGITRLKSQSFITKVRYLDLLRSRGFSEHAAIQGKSIEVIRSKHAWLEAATLTLNAIKFWRASKNFPYWFSSRRFIFHIAQLAAYIAALMAFLSLWRAAVLFAFAICITPQFFCTRLSWRKPKKLTIQLFRRIALYFIG